MIFRLIKRIRHQPKGTRDTIAISIAGVVTLVIAGVWIIRVPSQLAITSSQVSEEPSAFSTLFSSMGEQFSDMQAAVTASSASTSESVSAVQVVADEALLAEEMRYLNSSDPERSSTTSDQLVTTEATYTPREVRITTTSSSTTSSSTVVY